MLAHLLCVGFAGFVTYIARPGMPDSTVFSWHPTLMTAAFTLLAAEGVMMLSQSALIGGSAQKSSKVTGHWILMLLAAVSAVLGFLAIYNSKENKGFPHLVTPHAKLGAATVCYILLQLCAGTNLLYPQFISKFIDIRLMSRMHGLSGALLLLMATLTVVGGVTTDWFKQQVTGPAWLACLVCPLVIYLLIALQVLAGKNKDKTG